jgi:predicted ATPase with chaperone activity
MESRSSVRVRRGFPGRRKTVADLADTDDITAGHVAEAIHYRRLDRQL